MQSMRLNMREGFILSSAPRDLMKKVYVCDISACLNNYYTRRVKNAVYINSKRMPNKFLEGSLMPQSGYLTKRRFTMSKVLFSQAGPQKKVLSIRFIN